MNADELAALLQAMPEPKPVFWRLYYDEQGAPITYSMEDQPGTYIDVDPETFARAPYNVRVKNGRLIELSKAVQKLMPSDSGTPCHPDNVAIVVPETEPHQRWELKIHESN